MLTDKVESCGKRIKKALSLRGMTQAELCRLSGVPKSPLSQYIKGTYEPREDRTRAMARVLDVDPLWLLGYDVSMDGAKNASGERELDEGERLWLDIYHRASEDTRKLFITMINDFESLSVEDRRFLLSVIRLKLDGQK